MRLLHMRTLLRVLKHAACVLYLHGPLGLASYKTRPEQATHARITRLLECTYGQDLRPLPLNLQGRYCSAYKASTGQHTRSISDQHPLTLIITSARRVQAW